MNKQNISKELIKHLARLAYLTLSGKQIENFSVDIGKVLDFMSKIKSLDTKNVIETSQVTQMRNVLREDEIDKNRILSQEEALSNAKSKHNGYFKVEAVLE